DYFLAIKDNRVVGRITAQTNTLHNNHYHDKMGFFGFFECINDRTVAEALISEAVKWNKEHGRDKISGPFNFTINDICGLLVDGFDTPPYIMLSYNKPYYEKLLNDVGLVKAKGMYSYLTHTDVIPPKLERVAKVIEKRLEKENVTFYTLRKKKEERIEDIEIVFDIYRKAWKDNWGYVPMSEKEFDRLKDELLPIADPNFIIIAKKDNIPIGFSVGIPNYNRVFKVMNGKINPVTIVKALIAKSRIKEVRVMIMGILEEYRNLGVDAMFHYKFYQYGIPKGIFDGEFSWVLEDNVMMNRLAVSLGGIPYKTYQILEMDI
ncbi:MAG: GNAT family N-acetyltransferase, partial [Candidatus Cloacimonetes bacterium]|nr:GNAT family N-acetyltransferase [Candidatus Cloacimonadota bacterium]